MGGEERESKRFPLLFLRKGKELKQAKRTPARRGPSSSTLDRGSRTTIQKKIRELTLVLDESVLKKYADIYFCYHSKAKKNPVDAPYHPSINTWMVLPRMTMNEVKQKWKGLIVWWIQSMGYDKIHLESCKLIQRIYYPTNRRHDVDNTVPKFILDGFVEAGFLIDDDSTHLRSLLLECGVDKAHPRTEFIFYDITYLEDSL